MWIDGDCFGHPGLRGFREPRRRKPVRKAKAAATLGCPSCGRRVKVVAGAKMAEHRGSRGRCPGSGRSAVPAARAELARATAALGAVLRAAGVRRAAEEPLVPAPASKRCRLCGARGPE